MKQMNTRAYAVLIVAALQVQIYPVSALPPVAKQSADFSKIFRLEPAPATVAEVIGAIPTTVVNRFSGPQISELMGWLNATSAVGRGWIYESLNALTPQHWSILDPTITAAIADLDVYVQSTAYRFGWNPNILAHRYKVYWLGMNSWVSDPAFRNALLNP